MVTARMWIVRLALRRPYTFIVLAILIVLLGVFAILRTPTDIFPNIKIPIVAIIWRYNGLSPEEIANRIVLFRAHRADHRQRRRAHRVADRSTARRWSSTSSSRMSTRICPSRRSPPCRRRSCASSPPGTTPPFVLSYNASSVPILQLALSSESLSEAQIFDLGNNILRTELATVPGASIPYPYGGKQRQVQVDLDPQALRAKGLSANDVVNAIGAQNLILPAGTQKIGDREYFIKLNASPRNVERAQRPADPQPQRHRRSTCATWRTCATAIRRRPTSCAWTGSAPC